MTTAQDLCATHRVEERVMSIQDDVQGVDQKLKGVDDKIDGLIDSECLLFAASSRPLPTDRSCG